MSAVSLTKNGKGTDSWQFEPDDTPIQPYDALNPLDAYETAHEGLEQILVEVDDEDEDGFLAILEEAKNIHLHIKKKNGGSVYAIESTAIGKKLLENLPNIRQLDTDSPIQAVVDPEDEDSHREQYSGHQLDHQQQIGDGYSQIFDGCSPPEPVEEIKVCIADTGVACGHPDLPPAEDILGKDLVVDGDIRYGNCDDKHGHGTHMAGVIAAIQNGVGIIGGAAKVAKLISTRALYDDKMGSFGTMMAAIDGCVENGAKIIVLSLGCQNCDNRGVHHYIREIVENKDILIFAAAGNNGSPDPFFPASWPEVISVTATNRQGGRWAMSNYNDQVELGGLGYHVLSTDITKVTDHLGKEIVHHTYKASLGSASRVHGPRN